VRPTTVEIPTRLLVFGMTQANGNVDASELYDVAGACGLTPDQVRSCLRRLVDEGLFVRTGEGRDASFQATDRGLAALTSTVERTRLAYAQDAAGRGWDRRWRLVAYAVPEARRASRDSLRDRLVAMGGAPVQGGLYVSPHRWHDDVVAEATRLGVLESITIATSDDLEIGGERDPRRLASTLWALDDVALRYDAFLERFRDVPDTLSELRKQRRRLPDSAFLPGALVMAVAFQDVFEDDPLLPPELLPRPWPGRAARDLLIRSRRQALAIREAHGRAALFRFFDDMVEAIA
jgi:phenylacetic acid degradation operon negative regulatory protein